MTAVRLSDPMATEAFGRALAAMVRAGDVITLSGPLGAGKTSIARGLLAALGLAGEAPSPSFAIVQPYDPPETILPVLHVDLYRIDDPREIDELGLDEARADSVLLVEWPERAVSGSEPGSDQGSDQGSGPVSRPDAGAAYWPDALALALAIEPDGARRLTAVVPPAWEGRWPI